METAIKGKIIFSQHGRSERGVRILAIAVIWLPIKIL